MVAARHRPRAESGAGVIARYTLPEMATLWTDQARFEHMLRVEIAALGAVERRGLVPEGTTAAVAAKARVDVERIAELEKTTDHDVIAFVSQVAETTGPEGRFLHFGLTSSDVVDTALALQSQDAAELIDTALADLVEAIAAKAREHATTVMMGRTHSVHAEPITLGLKLASWAFELARGRRRIAAAAEEIAVGKLSGAVGTYSQLGPDIEAEVMAELGLGIESAATQVVSRDRHAAFLAAIAVCGGSIERAATEVRNLQHSEIGELQEPFRAGQKGSSAMPHKRNPITSERLAGLARLLRGYAGAALEDEALWHERDIAHSSVERVALPGATTLIHYMAVRMTKIVEGLVVRPERMRENLERGLGLYASGRLLTALVEQGGLSREDAYAIVQRAALKAADERRQLRELVEADRDVTSRLSADQIAACFDIDQLLRNVETIIDRLNGEAANVAG
jgi:adenylosuccinate lyase